MLFSDMTFGGSVPGCNSSWFTIFIKIYTSFLTYYLFLHTHKSVEGEKGKTLYAIFTRSLVATSATHRNLANCLLTPRPRTHPRPASRPVHYPRCNRRNTEHTSELFEWIKNMNSCMDCFNIFRAWIARRKNASDRTGIKWINTNARRVKIKINNVLWRSLIKIKLKLPKFSW